MRRVVFGVVAVLLTAGSGVRIAGQESVSGEVIHVLCYSNNNSGGAGAAHADCALKCAREGRVMGILTEDGAVYVIRGAYAANANERLIEFVAKQVQASGSISGSNLKYIDVAQMRLGN